MYDPEEACNENETTQDSKLEETQEIEDDKWADVVEVCTKEKPTEEPVEIKVEHVEEEEEEKVAANSPRTRRAATAKNIAGPKAKRGRK